MRSAWEFGKSEENPLAIEYKTVGAPERGRRRKGSKTRSDKVAAAMEDILRREAVDGWVYLRTDLIPVEERSGLFGRTREVHRAVMVFCRGGGDPGTQSVRTSQMSRSPAASAPPPSPGSASRSAGAVEAWPERPSNPASISPVIGEPAGAPAPRSVDQLEPEPRAPKIALASEMSEEPAPTMVEVADDAPPAMKITRAMERHKPTLKVAKI
ncbi:MAG: hypothetical protein AAF317_08950 [Pseudomonadota bacterium]